MTYEQEKAIATRQATALNKRPSADIAPPLTATSWIEVSYCSPSPFGQGYGTGSCRMYARDLPTWVVERMPDGKPILITGVKVL